MLRDFKLKIDNFGPINQADLNISKINIIAGKNASGKTSISKLLYCIITAFSTDGDYLSYESMKEQFNLLMSNLQIPYEESEKITRLNEIRFNIESDKEFKIETLLNNYDKFESFIGTLELDDEEFFTNTIAKNKEIIKRTQNIGNYWPLHQGQPHRPRGRRVVLESRCPGQYQPPRRQGGLLEMPLSQLAHVP